MQTVARANRVFPGKYSGLIVDYANVFASLEKALAIDRQGDWRRHAGARQDGAGKRICGEPLTPRLRSVGITRSTSLPSSPCRAET